MKNYAVAIRNKEDGALYGIQFVHSISDYVRDIAIFLAQHKATGFALYPDKYELAIVPVDYADATDVRDLPEPADIPSEDK